MCPMTNLLTQHRDAGGSRTRAGNSLIARNRYGIGSVPTGTLGNCLKGLECDEIGAKMILKGLKAEHLANRDA